jgi:hypothetical protein
MKKIKVSTDTNQTFKILLNNQLVRITLAWHDISNAWFISIYDINKNITYMKNKKINNNVFLFDSYYNLFSGDIVAFSTSSPYKNIEKEDFNSIYGLYYLTPAEFNEVNI